MSATRSVAPVALARTFVPPLVALLALGLVIRLVFLPSLGFHNDIAAFEAWTLALKDNPPWEFYAKTSFADYPPGYFIVLWVLAGIYNALMALHLAATNDPSYFVLRLLVKLPATAMDLVDAALIFALVRRYASETLALAAAAFFVLNPATIYVSAYWGQVDSVSWGLVLLAIWLALRSSDDPARTSARIAWAWAAMGFSILIKPQGALVALVLLAFAVATADAAVRRRRLIGTGIGLAGALAIAYVSAALFHGTLDPVADLAWLFERYRFGSAVYQYNTINAFNLYAIKQPFWQPDGSALPFSFPGLGTLLLGPMWMWGIVLVLAAGALVVTRYVQQRSERALLEGAMLIAFAFFALATRMHERYIFGAFLLSFPLIAFGRRYVWAAAILSVTTLLNLIYSFAYQAVMEAHPAGVDPTNLWPIGSHLVAAVNVALFFVLGYIYLGGSASAFDALERDATAIGLRARAWFDPREGVARMNRRDWVYAGAFAFASLALCLAWYWYPREQIFDEIYYARAGEEYLKHIEIFEFTHPPLTKLIITLSMLLFGGLSSLGDSSTGWRFLNIVVGALSVGVLYAFAKKLTSSTLFAAVAAGMLLFDGFHFVQSRIATPEITVAFFALVTLYAFYNVWTSSAVRRAPAFAAPRARWGMFAGILAAGAVVAAGIATLAVTLGPHTRGFELQKDAWFVAFAYVETIVYLGARWWLSRPNHDVVSYADGSRIVEAESGGILVLPEGERIAVGSGKREELAARTDDDAKRRYMRDGRLTYTTPAALATFEPAGVMRVDDDIVDGRDARRWLVVLALAGGAVAASKWNGLFDFFVVWLCVAVVAAQRWLRRPALFGNPFGMPLDVVMGTMLVAAGAIYTLAYVPFFTLGHNFLDMIALQTEMYGYHAHLVATHPYASSWWQWPILERPISYYYHDFRPPASANEPGACCVAEILALPNPFVWWFGLLTVPIVGVLAWLDRNRGYALLVVAYILQWLPWIGSPRIAFEYHFYPNLAIIVLCNAIVLQRVWNWRQTPGTTFVPRLAVGIYLAAVVLGFAFFYPVLAGVHITWDQWHARMWIPRWII